MKASVIIPVHNAEAYLRECLEPLTSQVAHVSGEKARETAHTSDEKADGTEKLAEATRSQFPFAYEIICVEDGSVDGSRAIIEEFVARPGTASRVRLVSLEESRGPSAARNAGIDAAEGEFLLFADSDDIPAVTFVYEPIQSAETHDADIVIFSFERYFGKRQMGYPRPRCWESALYDRPFSLEDTACQSIDFAIPSVWHVLWRSSFVKGLNIRFPEDLVTAEDMVFTYEAFLNCRRMVLLDENLYRYRVDGGTSLTKERRGPSGLKALDKIVNYGKSHGLLTPRIEKHLVNLILSHVHYALSTAQSYEEYAEIYQAFKEEWVEALLPYREMLLEHLREAYDAIREKDAEQFLFALLQESRQASAEASLELSAKDSELLRAQADGAAWRVAAESAYRSHSYRIGNALMDPLSKIRRHLSGGRSVTKQSAEEGGPR